MLVALVLLLAFSAFFSASETAISSINKIRVKNRAEEGDKKAAVALKNAEDYDKTLSAILIGNNVVNLTLSSIATLVATALLGDAGAAVATVVTTVLVLIFGEILPKSFAKDNAEQVAFATARPVSYTHLVAGILGDQDRLLGGHVERGHGKAPLRGLLRLGGGGLGVLPSACGKHPAGARRKQAEQQKNRGHPFESGHVRNLPFLCSYPNLYVPPR